MSLPAVRVLHDDEPCSTWNKAQRGGTFQSRDQCNLADGREIKKNSICEQLEFKAIATVVPVHARLQTKETMTGHLYASYEPGSRYMESLPHHRSFQQQQAGRPSQKSAGGGEQTYTSQGSRQKEIPGNTDLTNGTAQTRTQDPNPNQQTALSSLSSKCQKQGRSSMQCGISAMTRMQSPRKTQGVRVSSRTGFQGRGESWHDARVYEASVLLHETAHRFESVSILLVVCQRTIDLHGGTCASVRRMQYQRKHVQHDVLLSIQYSLLPPLHLYLHTQTVMVNTLPDFAKFKFRFLFGC